MAILSLAEAKHALNIPTANVDFDAELTQVINAASAFVDSVYGPVVYRSVTKTVLEPRGTIYLDRPSSITSVTEYSSGVATTLTAETNTLAGTYRLDTAQGALLRRSSWSGAAWGPQEVVIVYVAGRFANTASVDARFKEACAQVVIHLWQARGSGNGIGVVGGDGERFGAVPYSPAQLRKNLIALNPGEWVGPAVA